MIRIPYTKIPGVRVGSIGPTSNIGAGGATPAPPPPITYLTQWKLMGNSEVHGTEIWSCGEYNEVDNKWHIRILPEGYGVVDIALDEPLRKTNDVADIIEYANGICVLTRNFAKVDLGSFSWTQRTTNTSGIYRYSTAIKVEVLPNCIVPSTNIAIALCSKYNIINPDYTYGMKEGIGLSDASRLANGQILIYDSNANTLSAIDFQNYLQGVELIYQITSTTEIIQAPQIQEADSYSCVISQGGKAVSWSSFETE